MKEALKLALEALEYTTNLARFLLGNEAKIGPMLKADEAITAIKEALAQPEHIGFMDSKLNPIPRTWVGLTKDAVEILAYKAEGNTWIAVELTEAKLKEKNNG